jgi:predicted transcriptional regulator
VPFSQKPEGMDNAHRQRIICLLRDREKLSFSEIASATGITSQLLATHVKKLMESLLIEHYYEHEVGEERYSYYAISLFGKALLENMLAPLREHAGENDRRTEPLAKTVHEVPLPTLKSPEAEPYLEVLKAIGERVDKPTQIMFKTALSWNTLEDALSTLCDRELVVEKKVGNSRRYLLSTRGRDALVQVSKAPGNLSASPPPTVRRRPSRRMLSNKSPRPRVSPVT